MRELRGLIARNRAGSGEALPSVCSAHPEVITAALLLSESRDLPLLVEATSNQVNQFGGYTGMRPADFVTFVHRLCDENAVDRHRVLFGGDHLGPQVWRSRPAAGAMAMARDLVAEYVRAGFTKIHLDCSEGCAGEPPQVGDGLAAARAADLAAVCEATVPDPGTVSYIFGTEVPPPGGARAAEGHSTILPTAPEAAKATIAAHEAAFVARGLQAAWPRAVGLVVQPGLEFAPDHVIRFDLTAPDRLSPVLDGHPGLSFEAHSTDYQHADVFPELGRRHFAVLKVGPALTFAVRQALYALDTLTSWVLPHTGRDTLPGVMEKLMRADPAPWAKHYDAPPERLGLLLHFGYADRIRYYWTLPEAQQAVAVLIAALPDTRPPLPVLEQVFSPAVIARAESLSESGWARALVRAQVQEALAPYFACGRGDH